MRYKELKVGDILVLGDEMISPNFEDWVKYYPMNDPVFDTIYDKDLTETGAKFRRPIKKNRIG